MPAGSFSGDGAEKAFSGNVSGWLNEQRLQLRSNEMMLRVFLYGSKGICRSVPNFILQISLLIKNTVIVV
ncbi:hypothetical protein EO98_15740 [Methanosarcina sp. 2.H.T.1A.6]|nr:hypothetical protein EO97_04935 [Methanosarcina sp. 2.H.T.1A.15]KKG17616.1 hypothetical protein EO94_12165 [Methanosarcina sp. 2.H.T.1A.3]KKG21856.1 hypothetical protein EO98_15740 [Methanosarcina sp. 2.H.T.1A.6]KKG25392.1 hypothetical protein EO96_00190 [Methanosarcina sp. 2.H.T.1A.8]